MQRQVRIRFLKAFKDLERNPYEADIKAMQGNPYYRLRIGGMRAVLQIEKSDKKVFVLNAGFRGDIYK